MQSHDDYALNGQWHYCPECCVNWSDADGGCDCYDTSDEYESEDQDEAETLKWDMKRKEEIKRK